MLIARLIVINASGGYLNVMAVSYGMITEFESSKQTNKQAS